MAAVALLVVSTLNAFAFGQLSASTFDSCVSLSPSLRMHYTIDGDTVDMVLEGKLPDPTADSWYLSYGYSDAGAKGSEMTGGTAVLGGLVNGECFGYDYFLDGTLECNYAGGYGSCPTFLYNNGAQSTTSLVECEKSGDTLAVRMTKKLMVDEPGIPGTAWPVDDSKFAMWAYGQVDPSSTVEQPMALLHVRETPRLPGLKIALGTPQNSCEGSFGIVGGAAADQISPSAPATAPTAPAASVLPADTSATANATEPACAMVVDGIMQNFQTCSLVKRVGKNFDLMWNLTADPNDPSVTIMTMGMSATMPDQYVSVGFPSKPGSMKNAAAMIMANSAAGSSLKQYYMTGYGVKDVFPSSQGMDLMTVTEPTGMSSNGEMTGMFTMRLPYAYSSMNASSNGGVVGSARRLFAAGAQADPLASYPMIFAAGDVNPDGSLRRHYNDASSKMNLAQAVEGPNLRVSNDAAATTNESVKVAHQVIMAVGWGVIIPLGIVGGRAKMQLSAPKWYNVHRYMQSFGYLIGLVGVGLGFGITKSWETPYPVHRDLGITITVLATVQVAALLWKPAPGTSLRVYWSPFHIWMGRSTAILAIANIYYGMLGMGKDNVETWAWVVYTVALGLIVVLGLYSERREYVLRRAAREQNLEDPENGSLKTTSASRAASVGEKSGDSTATSDDGT